MVWSLLIGALTYLFVFTCLLSCRSVCMYNCICIHICLAIYLRIITIRLASLLAVEKLQMCMQYEFKTSGAPHSTVCGLRRLFWV